MIQNSVLDADVYKFRLRYHKYQQTYIRVQSVAQCVCQLQVQLLFPRERQEKDGGDIQR